LGTFFTVCFSSSTGLWYLLFVSGRPFLLQHQNDRVGWTSLFSELARVEDVWQMIRGADLFLMKE
jgi:hypothetical protein